jgi:ubiquinone/menaquinone biosynthesis C-methylase UbiE
MYKNFAQQYAQIEYSGSGYLVYRDLPRLFKQFIVQDTHYSAIDYGCGTGDSTNILTAMSFNTLAVDCNQNMLEIGRQKNKLADFQLISNNHVNTSSSSFDFALSCLVFMEVSSVIELTKIFSEIYRILKPGGVFIFVVTTKHLYSGKWLSVDTNFPQNHNLFSGKQVKILLTDINLEIDDYYWSESDYDSISQVAGFSILEKNYPLGLREDGINWKDEYTTPPYVQYVLKK